MHFFVLWLIPFEFTFNSHEDGKWHFPKHCVVFCLATEGAITINISGKACIKLYSKITKWFW